MIYSNDLPFPLLLVPRSDADAEFFSDLKWNERGSVTQLRRAPRQRPRDPVCQAQKNGKAFAYSRKHNFLSFALDFS